MKDCSICKYCDEDFIFDEETGEEYPFYGCQKGNNTSLDYKCKDFEQYKPKNIKRKIPNAIYVNTEKNVQNIVLG